MSWLESMKRDALAIVLEQCSDWPQVQEYTYTEGDQIDISVDFERGYAYSEYTYDSSHMSITVTVRRDYEYLFSYEYTDDEASAFFTKLMSWGYSDESGS